MSLLDADALERARQAAGVLPTRLAGSVGWSVDQLTAALDGRARDHDITLADIRKLAAAVGVAPIELFTKPRNDAAGEDLGSRVAIVLLHERIRDIDGISDRLNTTTDDILDAVDAWNARPTTGLKIMVHGENAALMPDPRVTLPERSSSHRASRSLVELERDQLLWSVLDRNLPAPNPVLQARLEALAREGLIQQLDGEWRPTDAVIQSLDLTDWDSAELIAFARSRGKPDEIICEK